MISTTAATPHAGAYGLRAEQGDVKFLDSRL